MKNFLKKCFHVSPEKVADTIVEVLMDLRDAYEGKIENVTDLKSEFNLGYRPDGATYSLAIRLPKTDKVRNDLISGAKGKQIAVRLNNENKIISVKIDGVPVLERQP